MQSLPHGYTAVVVGSSGGIGSALMSALQTETNCANVIGLARSENNGIDLTEEPSIAKAAQLLKQNEDVVHLIIDATGTLSFEGEGPEKSLAPDHNNVPDHALHSLGFINPEHGCD